MPLCGMLQSRRRRDMFTCRTRILAIVLNKLWNFVSDFTPQAQALRTRVDISTGFVAYVLAQKGKLHATRSGLHAQHSVTFCGELEGMAPHLSCGQTDSRMRYVSSPDEVWTA